MAVLKYYDSGSGTWKFVIGPANAQYIGLASSIDMPKGSADTPDDNFLLTTLDAKWTVVSGSSGTVNPFLASTSQQAIYDLTSVPGMLALQPHYTSTQQSVYLRQDYTLATSSSIVMKLFTAGQVSSNTAGEITVGLYLNASNTSPTTGGYCFITFQVNTDGWELRGKYLPNGGGGAEESTWGDVGNEWAFNGAPLYFRITRISSSVYVLQVSLNGLNWTSMRKFTSDITFDNVWISAVSTAAVPSAQVAPVQLIDYVRLGNMSMIPWT